MKQELGLPRGFGGDVWYYKYSHEVLVPHRHDELELNFVTRGRGAYLLGEVRYELRPRDLLWLFPAQDHLLLRQSADFEMWILVWKPETVRAVVTQDVNRPLCAQDPEGSFHRRLSEEQAGRLHTLFSEIRKDNLDLLNAGMGYSLISAWAEFEAASDGVAGADVHPAIERAARLLGDGGDVGLDGLAHAVGMSPSHLSRLFKQQMGLSISEFRNRRRLEAFFKLYGRGRRSSLSQAALEAGFGSYPQFHRVFKELTGHGPAEFAERERRREEG